MSAFGQSVENSLAYERDKERRMYPWCADEAEEQARQRYHDALESGLSDYEAREEGWPSTQSDESVRAPGAETRTDQ